MKREFQNQLVISVIIVLVCSVMNTLIKHWIFSSIGYCVNGFLWIMHPVKINDGQPEKRQFAECRVAGVILILLGIMLRAKYY